MAIFLENRQNALPIRPRSVKRRLNKLLAGLGHKGANLNVLLTGDLEMRDLNRTFLKKDRPANVLSFPPGQTFPGEVKSLGDLALSGETIKREAGDLGWTEGAAFYFYLIHGLLHLLGYDHSLGPDEDMAQTEETERLFALIPHGL